MSPDVPRLDDRRLRLGLEMHTVDHRRPDTAPPPRAFRWIVRRRGAGKTSEVVAFVNVPPGVRPTEPAIVDTVHRMVALLPPDGWS